MIQNEEKKTSVKMRIIIIAIAITLVIFQIEKNYTKEQIIEFYANKHQLGGTIYGIIRGVFIILFRNRKNNT